MGAALYDAEGLSKEQKTAKAGKTELLQTNNLLSQDARGIALEMQKVASYSRSEKPVWNIAMSAPVGVELSAEQWRTAAAQNLMALGVELDRYQFAIYRHRDTRQDHVHILLNAVPVDGRPALSRQFKAVAAKKAAPKIDQAVGIVAVKGAGVREELARILTLALKQYPTTPVELETDLAELGVTTSYKYNSNVIYGVTFQLASKDHKPIKGSDVVLPDGQKAKWATLAAVLEANRAQYEAELERLRQEKAKLEQERDEARNKPERVVEVEKIVYRHDEAKDRIIEQLRQEKAELQRQRDQIRKQPLHIVDKQVIDVADKREIERLKKENDELKGKLETREKVITAVRKTTNILINSAQAGRLLEGKKLVLSDARLVLLIENNQLRVAHLERKAPVAVPKSVLVERFEQKFNVTPTPEQVEALREGKRQEQAPTAAVATTPAPAAKPAPEPIWYSKLRKVLSEKRKAPALITAGFAYKKSKNDLLIWPAKGSKEEAVKLSEFAPGSKMLNELGNGIKLRG